MIVYTLGMNQNLALKQQASPQLDEMINTEQVDNLPNVILE